MPKELDEIIEAKGGLNMVSKRLFESRTILLFGEINMKVAERVAGQLFALSQESQKAIKLVINSPGGHVESGDTIHDMIQFVSAPVQAIGTGWVASAGAHIFLAADKSRRFCLPNTRFMLHQPSGGVGGQASDIEIEVKEMVKMRERLNRIISERTGQPLEKVEKDTDRNHWMSAEEAKDYGLVASIVNNVKEIE